MTKCVKQKGFTLLELLFVITIIATLANLSVPYLKDAVARSRLTEFVAQVDSLRTGFSSAIQSGQYSITRNRGYKLTEDGIADDARAAGISPFTYPGLDLYIKELAPTGSTPEKVMLMVVDQKKEIAPLLQDMVETDQPYTYGIFLSVRLWN